MDEENRKKEGKRTKGEKRMEEDNKTGGENGGRGQ